MLEEIIRARIAEEGPLPVSSYMALCLMHPEHGYYTRGQPFGAEGDFLTAPEISQAFGEIIGLWLMQLWSDMGRPGVDLVELGPGRGLLMRDVLRTANRALPAFLAAAHLHLVEASARLRAEQERVLAPFPITAKWHANVPECLQKVPLLVANEFLDALPVVQYIFAGGAWRERLVGVKDGALAFIAAPQPADPALLPAWVQRRQPREGDIVELSPAVDALVEKLCDLILKAGQGAALLIDYGHGEPGFGDTLQGVRAHRHADVLRDPGRVDLTAHVNFARITELAEARGLGVYGPVEQGAWLKALGIEARGAALAESAAAQGLDAGMIARGIERLVSPGGMGRLFKVMVLVHPQGPVPAPFLPPAS